jgi:ribosomal protein S18 acetylase RimI-like enzyme
MYPGLYQAGTSNPVLIAESGGDVAGAIMLNIGIEKPDEGSVGCTVTANIYRNRGIATTMVQIATRQLQKAGLKKATLGYTYTYILNLYGRSGYKVSMEYFMAKKKL